MIRSRFLNSFYSLGLGTCLLLLSCGKKTETVRVGLPEVQRPAQTEIDTFLSKQMVNCEGNQACPNYLAKVVVNTGRNNFKYCTGFLTEDNMLATSASCLPNLLRLSGQDCSNDLFFFFPKTTFHPAERVGCKKVALVSQLNGDDPILWRDDVAFLELNRPLTSRRNAQISRSGIENSKVYTTWMIDQQDEYSAIIKKSNCEAIHQNYVNPLVTSASSPNMMFGDCSTTNGGRGAPVIDGRGKVRGMISEDMHPAIRTYLESTGLLSEELKSMVHGTNFACAPTTTDNDMLDERECLADLNYIRVDRLRSEMLSSKVLFGKLRKELETSLENVSKFVRFDVKLIPKGDFQDIDIFPLCFKPFETWLSGMSEGRNVYVDDVKLPMSGFRRSMTAYGKIVAKMIDGDSKVNLVQFSLKNIRAAKRSSVLMWLQDGSGSLRTFPGIVECSESLL